MDTQEIEDDDTPYPHVEDRTIERMVEWTVKSRKAYKNPFNDVDVDVVFSMDEHSWRVPMFWRGDNQWTVRFAAPKAGKYSCHLECTDRNNPDLNDRSSIVTVDPYSGPNALLRRGMLRVSANKRHFEHADGTPFLWLGDTWWNGLSSRLNWDGFQELTADRKAKGFTVILVAAGLGPNEEVGPCDPGFCNEGGSVWDNGFKEINPRFFDSADRRIECLLNAELIPAITGAWRNHLEEMGVEKLKKHWRYIIARYSAYPVLWIAGGEVFDPPAAVARESTYGAIVKVPGGWTDITRYIRSADPMHHPLSVHECTPDDLPLEDDSLTDFPMFHPCHYGWNSVAVEIAQLNSHYSRIAVTKPLVVGEIGYEGLGGSHLEDFQRVAFWLGMLNGAAGYTYGANGVWESYTNDKPFQRLRWSLLTWQEGMHLPGSYQIGLGAKLIGSYRWWEFQPHPEWVTPRGTTLLHAHDGDIHRFHLELSSELEAPRQALVSSVESDWKKNRGNFRLPYAAGIPRKVRFIYIPYLGFGLPDPPTILGIETHVRYHAFFWEPSLGVKIDMGTVIRPACGELLYADEFAHVPEMNWTFYDGQFRRHNGRIVTTGKFLAVINNLRETNLVARVDTTLEGSAGIILRFQDTSNFIVAVYSSQEQAIYLLERRAGVDSNPKGLTLTPGLAGNVRLSSEVRDGWAAVSVTDDRRTYTSEIVAVSNVNVGSAGLMHSEDGTTQSFAHFELRRVPPLQGDHHIERTLHDARGAFRGELRGAGSPFLAELGVSSWDIFGKEKIILLDGYRPERLPYCRDWLLVLESMDG